MANAILKIILENSENIEVFRCYPLNNNSTTGKVTVKEILDTIKIFSILTIDSNIQHNNGKILISKKNREEIVETFWENIYQN